MIEGKQKNVEELLASVTENQKTVFFLLTLSAL
jgi:hypothetical protein